MEVHSVDVKMEAFYVDALVDQLEGISTTVNRNINRILRESSEPLMEAIKANTPVNIAGVTRPEIGHAKDHVVRTNVKRVDGGRTVEVGYDGQVGWYMWFLEQGTYSGGAPKGIAPQHNVERALNGSKADILLIQEDGLRRLVAKYT